MGTRKHFLTSKYIDEFSMLLSGNLQKPASSQLATYQQGKVCERYTGRNISRQVRLLSAGLKASQSWTTWMIVPNIQTMLDSNAPKTRFFSKKTTIWRWNFNLERNFNPIEKCWVKNQSLHQNRAQTQKKKHCTPHYQRGWFHLQPVPSRSLIRSGLLFSFFLQGGPLAVL